MIPQILLGVALGLLAVGCSSKNTNPPRNPGRDPEGDPKYRYDFGEDLQAQWIHLELMKNGFSDSLLDKGCPTYQFPKPGVTTIKPEVGKEDRTITPCEVYEFTLNQWQNPKVRPLAERLAGKPIPWSLDDFDPKTTFDQEVRKVIKGYITEIDKVLQKQGYGSWTPEYQERMAVALFVWIEMEQNGFDALMKEPDTRPEYKQSYIEFKKDLEKLGLAEIWEKIKLGGLRVKGDYTKEYSALESLRKQYGECTEHSKILYAAFKISGLDPFFISLYGADSEHPDIKNQMQADPAYFHVVIGIKINGKTRLFDGALLDLDPPHPKYLQISLRQYLSLDFNNQAGSQEKLKNYDEAFHFLRMAKILDPFNFLTYNNIGNAYGRISEYNKAIEELNAGLRINPYSGMILTNRGEAFRFLDQYDKALEDYSHAIEVQPNLPNPHLGRGLVYNLKGEYDESDKNFIEGFRIAPLFARDKLLEGFKDTYRKELKQVPAHQIQNIQKELGSNLVLLLAHFHMINFLYPAGQKAMAMDPIQQLVKNVLSTKKKLKKEWTEYYPGTINTLYNLFEGLPPTLRKEPEVSQLWDSLQLPPRPKIEQNPVPNNPVQENK